MRAVLFTLFSLFAVSSTASHLNGTLVESRSSNSCVTFQVGSGTGCDWMCNYCASHLGTYNYYFTTDVCTYQTGGCVGTPLANTPYTCCAV